MKRLFIGLVALALAGCSSTTSPLTPMGASKDVTCRSGYAVADRNGVMTCVTP